MGAWAPISCLVMVLAVAPRFSLQASPVNIFFVNEQRNSMAERALRAARRYFERNPTVGQVGEINFINVNGTGAENMVENVCNQLDAALKSENPPHVILDTTLSGLPSEVVKAISRALTIPTISASYGEEYDLREWMDLSVDEKEYLIQIMPPGDIITQVIRAIVDHQNITSAAVLFDESFEMDHKYKSLLQNMPTRHIIHVIDPTDADVEKQLDRLVHVDIFNFFVISKPNNIVKVLNAAHRKGLFNRKYAWYTISKEQGDIACKSCQNASVVHMFPVPEQEGSMLSQLSDTYGLKDKPAIDAAFYFDLAVRTVKTVGEMIEKGTWIPTREAITCEVYNKDDPPLKPQVKVKSALKEDTFTPTYGPLTIETNGLSWMNFQMQLDKYHIVNGQTATKNKVGSWKGGWPIGELQFDAGRDLSDHVADIVYRVVTVVQPPFVERIEDCNGEKCYEGYCIQLLEEIRKIIPFDYEIREVDDKKYGAMDDNKQWNGMIRELVDKKADIALGALSVMAERENVIDFTVPYYDLVGISILMKKPSVPTSLFKFLTVLETDVWLCILAAYFFTSLLLWIFDRWSPYSYQNNKEKYKDDDEKREFTLKESLWFCMTSLTPQGGGEAPKNVSGRLVAATWWLFGFIIIASYTANLAAFLTVSRLDAPIESLDDLSKQYKIQYAPMNGTSSSSYFERMAYIEHKFYEIWKDMSLNDSLDELQRAKLAVWDYPVSDKFTKMWQAMKETKLPDTFADALVRVRNSKSSSEGFAFLGEATEVKYTVMTSCDLVQVGEEFSRKPFAVGVQKGSPLKDQFSEAILKLLNQRKLETLKERWWNQNPKKQKCDKDSGQSDGISIQNIGGVFIVIFVGIGLACITLAFEYWYYKHRMGGAKVGEVDGTPGLDDNAIAAFGQMEKTNFNTQYNKPGQGVNLAPVDNPW